MVRHAQASTETNDLWRSGEPSDTQHEEERTEALQLFHGGTQHDEHTHRLTGKPAPVSPAQIQYREEVSDVGVERDVYGPDLRLPSAAVVVGDYSPADPAEAGRQLLAELPVPVQLPRVNRTSGPVPTSTSRVRWPLTVANIGTPHWCRCAVSGGLLKRATHLTSAHGLKSAR